MSLTMKTTPVVCGSERELLDLVGDGSEMVKVTFDPREANVLNLNGWWLYERGGDENAFTRQTPNQEAHSKRVDRVFCETIYLQFDRDMGILPNSFDYHYHPLGSLHREERDVQIAKLRDREVWKD